MAANGEQDQDMDGSVDIITIAPDGELLLEAIDEKRDQTFTYRVDIDRIRPFSAYFQRLLDPKNGYKESATVSTKLSALRKRYGHIVNVPLDELPHVVVSDIGKISKVNSIKGLFKDFLRVLHGQDITSNPASPGSVAMPLTNVANLAVVADRFDALPHTTAYIRRKRILESIEARQKAKSIKLPEERLRQKMLIGILFDHPLWVTAASQSLIITGSSCWKRDASIDDDLPLWWDLPRGLEEELITRRDYVLDTLQSIALHFINLYSSGNQQCKLGYASSWICDSFQLGEMTKFLGKNKLIKLGPVLTGQDEADPYTGDIERGVIETYKSCPTYRMDEFHTHCGLRTRLLPLIEQLEAYVRSGSVPGVGICGDCWNEHRRNYAWSEAKRQMSWRAPIPRPPSHIATRKLPIDVCLQQHARARDMFMAVDRDWTPKEEMGQGLKFGVTTPFLKHD